MAYVSVDAVMKQQPGAQEGAEVTIKAWVRNRRDSKAGLSFIPVSDGSCFAAIQVVAPAALENYESEVKRLTTGCSVEVDGVVVASRGKGQAFEIKATAVRVVGWVDDPETYPVSPKRHTMEYLREHAHLRVRTNTFGAVARVRDCVSQAIHRFFSERGYLWVHTPIVTANDCEGAGEMFRVSTLDMANPPRTDAGGVDYAQDFFGTEASLTVSGQLNVETYACALSKVYTFGPTFRAENSNTSRHLAEFWMVEPELAFADLKDVADLSVDFLRYIFKAVLAERADDMAFFDKHVQKGVLARLESVLESEFTTITYTEAVEILQKTKKKFEYKVEWGADLQSEHERFLTEQHFKGPVIVTDYPKGIKAFYMRMNDDGETVAAMDVLCPGVGEIIGGAQREERLDVLDARLDALGLPKEDYSWYRDLRRYGTVPHGGFGLGLERVLMFITGIGNVRDIIPFPRAANLCDF